MLSCRLMYKQAKVDQARVKSKECFHERVRAGVNSSFISKHTDDIVKQKISHSLREIFDVLKVTEKMNLDQNVIVNLLPETKKTGADGSNSVGTKVETSQEQSTIINSSANTVVGTSSKVEPNQELVSLPKKLGASSKGNNKEEIDTQLDLIYADARHVQPLELAQSLNYILSSFLKVEPPKRLITLREFIEKTHELMCSSALPSPINYLLTPLTHYEERKKRQSIHLSSEELEYLQHVRSKPILEARKVTNKLTSYRGVDRHKKKISIEDSLLSCKL
jgi:hypothetical protein